MMAMPATITGTGAYFFRGMRLLLLYKIASFSLHIEQQRHQTKVALLLTARPAAKKQTAAN
ncbi:hypothetical protein [Brenneria sp. g21c3]|uniref:hypothetical protein n=1 Tax=Brenneria sp. g21c3 TaxID=3093893 RepID=UPI002ED2D579